MAVDLSVQKKNLAYGMGSPLLTMAPEPFEAQRAPTVNDRAIVGQLWIDVPNDDLYFLTKIAAGVSTWIPAGGGTGLFTDVTATGFITAGGAITAGTTMTVSGLGLGVVQSSAVGLLSASDGTNGQVLIASTGAAAPVWAAIAAGAGINVTNGAGTIQIDATGATAVSYVTDVAGPIVPTGLGAVNILGGLNITSDGSVANTVSIGLDNNVAVAGSLTAGVDLTMSTGNCVITSDTGLPQCIYLHADGGIGETIDIYADQGSGVDSISLLSDVGGITIAAGLAAVDAHQYCCWQCCWWC